MGYSFDEGIPLFYTMTYIITLLYLYVGERYR